MIINQINGTECVRSPSLSTESGLVSGICLPNDTVAFLGIPYAAPPLGSLRWRPPQPPSSWSGVRSAASFAPSAPQFAPPTSSIYCGGETSFSEDCLYLNVYTGGLEHASPSRPVLVWFHFGAFQFGSASNPIYSGANLAREDLTVVTVNYRLGRLGFLCHPDLSAESDNQVSGNYGIMDQIAALKWVQRNIASFGGDPGNVTIGGASAGGASVHILRASPLAKGLFHKAVVESGPGIAPAVDGPGHIAAYTTLQAAEAAGEELLRDLGVSSIDELRQVPVAAISSAHLARARGIWETAIWPGGASLAVFDTKSPVVDGHVLPLSPLDALRRGPPATADVPLLAGNVGNEASGLPFLTSLAAYRTFAHETFGGAGALLAEEALRLYPARRDDEVRAATAALLADQVFTWPTWTAARVQAGGRFTAPVWYFRFLRAPPVPRGGEGEFIESEYAGAFHCAVGPYAFRNLDARQWAWTDADRALEESVSAALVAFVKTGDPSPPGLGRSEPWPRLESELGEIRVWDNEGCTKVEKALGSRLADITAFWDRYYSIKEL